MTNRTIQFLGQGYAPTGTTPIIITATLAGNVVYSGTIPTQYTSDVSRLPEDQTVLFTCEIPVAYSATVPMVIDLNSPVGVDVYLTQITSNYMPVYTGNGIQTSSGASTFLNIGGQSVPDPRSNVVINGVPQTRNDTPSGTWGWEIEFPAEDSGTFACDLAISAGLE